MNYYKPNYALDLDSPFARDGDEKLIRRNYWLDLSDDSIVMLFNNGIGQNLTNEEKKNHLIDIKRQHLIEKICIQEVIPSDN
tara:strand:- start:271 stop:516 length:246 start_codon:yes stop_codon:yes gene_type:complete